MQYLPDAVADGRFFSCAFTKRSNGETRRMVARRGVRRYLKGGERSYDPAEKNLLVVYDVQARGFRSIPLDAVIEVRVRGEVFR